MSQTPLLTEFDYPESDGRPMGETDLHRWWMIRIYDLLKYRYRDQHVYVGSDLLLYYVEGQPKKFVVPDDFVVLDCKPEFRRVFKTWSEQRVPNVVFEVTSRKTRQQDLTMKPKVYAEIGVKELFLYDPTLDYLNPALQGYRLDRGRSQRATTNASGAFECHELGLLLRLDRERLVIQDATTGLPLLTEAETHWEAIESAQARKREAEARAAIAQSRVEAAEARIEAIELRAKLAELEVERLREQLDRRPDSP
jgi:Uma2 family endonuclease